jgi:hypothetical protein
MKKSAFYTTLVFTMLILFMLTAFRNPGKKASSKNISILTDYFPVLCISKEDFESLLKRRPPEDRVKKLVFVFNLDDKLELNPSLTIFRSKSNAKFLSKTPSHTLTRTSKKYKISGEYYLGNLELTSTLIKKIQQHAQYPTANSLLFYPVKGTDNHIYYDIFIWDEDCNKPIPEKTQLKNKITLLGAASGLNPSPPYDPEQ